MPNVDHRQYDAVIVLANCMDDQGNLNLETRARVDLGVQAIKDGKAPLLVTCGWAHPDHPGTCIADAMRRYAIEHHRLDRSVVIAEPEPRDTVGDAVFTKRKLAAPRGWSRALVVTSRYHAARALAIFSFVYGPTIQVDCIGSQAADEADLGESETQSMAAFRDTFQGIAPGDNAAIFERLRSRHPFYNGDIYPQI